MAVSENDEIICDACRATWWFAAGSSALRIRRAAKKNGWARRRRNSGLMAHYIDLCPECAAKELPA